MVRMLFVSMYTINYVGSLGLLGAGEYCLPGLNVVIALTFVFRWEAMLLSARSSARERP